MSVHVRKADEGDVPGIEELWEEFMELLRCTNPDYWKVKDGRAAFSKYVVSTIREADILLAVAETKGAGLVGFSLAQIELLPGWFFPSPRAKSLLSVSTPARDFARAA